MTSRLIFRLFLPLIAFFFQEALLAGPPNLPAILSNELLPSSRFAPFETAHLNNASVVWLNLPLLKELGFNVERGQTPELEQAVLKEYAWVAVDKKLNPAIVNSSRNTAYADFYGGGGLEKNVGSARAGNFGKVQVKGIGQTPMLKSNDSFHTGLSSLYESMKDAVWGNFTHQELPYGGNRIIALISRHPDVKERGGPQILEVREQPLRVAHYMRRKENSDAADALRAKESLDHLPEALPHPKDISSSEWAKLERDTKLVLGLKEYALRIGRQHGQMSAMGIYHGTNSQSNIEINGRLLDFVTATSQPGYAPISLLEDVKPFGLDYDQTKTALIDTVVKEFSDANQAVAQAIHTGFPKGASKELGKIYDSEFKYQTRKQALELLGVPTHLIDALVKSHPTAADALVNFTKIQNHNPVSPFNTLIRDLPKSTLSELIARIHAAKTWDSKSLRSLGMIEGYEELEKLLSDAVQRSEGIGLANFRKVSSLKARWYDRPLTSLYYDDFRRSWLESNVLHSQANVAIDTITTMSQRKVQGLSRYEVPVSIRTMEGSFRKEITTFDGKKEKWYKLFFVTPGTDIQGINIVSATRGQDRITIETIMNDVVVRVPANDPEDVFPTISCSSAYQAISNSK